MESRASKIERERAKLGIQQLRALKNYTTKPQDEQDRIRKESQTHSISIVAAILQDSKLPSTELTEFHHKQALEYLSIHLSVRDRKQLIRCLCDSNPDYLTLSVREIVDAYEPVIRRLHKAIDLSSTLSDVEYFIKDLIKLAKIHNDHKSNKPVVPTVGDFVQLLRKHQRSCHVFMHQCAKNDKELTGWYLDWAKNAAAQFKRVPDPDAPEWTLTHKGAGRLTASLHKLFESLPEETQSQIRPVLDSHSSFLEKMHSQSAARLANVLRSPPSRHPAIAKIFSAPSSRTSTRPSSPAPGFDRNEVNTSPPSPSESSKDLKDSHHHHLHAHNHHPAAPPEVSSNPGPGAFLARWQALLDATPITPLTQKGPMTSASSPEVVQSSATDVDGTPLVEFAGPEASGDKVRVVPELHHHDHHDHHQHRPSKEKGEHGHGGRFGYEVRAKQRETKIVVDALGEEFRKMLARDGCYW